MLKVSWTSLHPGEGSSPLLACRQRYVKAKSCICCAYSWDSAKDSIFYLRHSTAVTGSNIAIVFESEKNQNKAQPLSVTFLICGRFLLDKMYTDEERVWGYIYQMKSARQEVLLNSWMILRVSIPSK